MGFFIAIVVLLALYILVSTLYLSVTSTGKKTLPAMRETDATRRASGKAVLFCPKCGRPFEGSRYCAGCGASSTVTHSYSLPISGSITAQAAEKQVNEFLAQNPYIYDCCMHVEYKTILMFPFVQLRFRVKSLKLTFTLSQKPQAHRFGMAFLYKYRLFGSIGYSQDKLVGEFLKNNPSCKVVNRSGSRVQHYSTRGNFEAHYYCYTLFKESAQ